MATVIAVTLAGSPSQVVPEHGVSEGKRDQERQEDPHDAHDLLYELGSGNLHCPPAVPGGIKQGIPVEAHGGREKRAQEAADHEGPRQMSEGKADLLPQKENVPAQHAGKDAECLHQRADPDEQPERAGMDPGQVCANGTVGGGLPFGQYLQLGAVGPLQVVTGLNMRGLTADVELPR